MSVKSHLTSGVSVRSENSVTYSVGNGGQKICRVFSETALFKSYGVICLPMASYSDIAAVFCAIFRQQSFLKLLKKTNSRLNATWNMTQCKAASFFLFSLHLLLTNLPYTFCYTHFSSACTFQDLRTCGAEGSALYSGFHFGCPHFMRMRSRGTLVERV